MNLAFLTPGTGSYYCGACMRDNALAKSLHAAGHQVSLLPMYLPLELDEDVLPQSGNPIFFGGINVFLQQKLGLFRHTPRWVHALLNHPGLLRFAAGRSHMTSAREHGEMALAMLRIEDSHFGKELDKLIEWLATDPPDIVCLGTALQAGMIRELKQRLNVKVICCFQGEDSFLDGLPEPFKTECWSELRTRSADADLLIAPSQFYADLIRQRLDAPDLRIEVMPNGIELDGYGVAESSSPPVIGFLARMIREKGLHHFVEAFIHLRTHLKHPDARIHIAGAATAGDLKLIAELKLQLEAAGLPDQTTWSPNISREEKADMLASLTLFSVPATYPEAFGLYLIEAMASSVPVVQPRASSFPEIIATSGGGVLVTPGDPIALATSWHDLLNHPERLNELGQSGRRAAKHLYSVAAMRDRFLALADLIHCRS